MRPSSATSGRCNRFPSSAVEGRTRSPVVDQRGQASPRAVALIRIFGELRERGYGGGYDPVLRPAIAQGARRVDGGRLCTAEVRTGASLPVRLEPRSRPGEWRDGDHEGRPCPAYGSRCLPPGIKVTLQRCLMDGSHDSHSMACGSKPSWTRYFFAPPVDCSLMLTGTLPLSELREALGPSNAKNYDHCRRNHGARDRLL
jgi:hypothetical protein